MNAKNNYNGLKGVFKFIANVVSFTALVILILLALFLAYYTISTKIYEKRGEKFEPFVSLYTIISPSMTPNINVWDVVVSKKVNSPKEIKVGDVITFISTSSVSKGMTVTHRVVEITKNENGVAYKTKGDNNLSPDSAPAEYRNLIGKVILRIPQLGRVQDFLGTKGGWLIVIVIPALIIIISDILKIFKLVGVKNKIEKVNSEEEQKKVIQTKKEEKRKENIKKRLNMENTESKKDTSDKPDYIVTKKQTRVVIAGEKRFRTYDKIDTPPKIVKRNRKRRRKR